MNDRPTKTVRKASTIRFWEGLAAEIDLDAIAAAAVPVKGVSYHSPLRFLEIYAEITARAGHVEGSDCVSRTNWESGPYAWEDIERIFWPRIPFVDVHMGENTPQPPFPWRDAAPHFLCVSFTYNTNALYRILDLLLNRDIIAHHEIDSLLDRACFALARIYTARGHFVMKNMNNNFNMFLISRVAEVLLGKDRYDSDCQEMESTRKALGVALSMVSEHRGLDIIEKMGLALGRGVSFIESRLHRERLLGRVDAHQVREAAYRYFDSPLAIDHREELLDMITNAGLIGNAFSLAVILDDATESVDDLLWLDDLMAQFPFLRIHLLLNTAQISINFSSEMLGNVLGIESFRRLAGRLGSQFFVTQFYCPFISFQTNLLTPDAREIIARSDAVYIKGANFFETCQIPEKHTFHAFVVYGPISRAYTGLNDYSGVFVHLPPGTTGFLHSKNPDEILTLSSIVLGQSGESNRTPEA